MVFFAREYVPSFLQTVWLGSSRTLRKQTPLLAGFVRAWARAVDYLWSHPIDSAARYARATNADPNLIAITLADERVRSYFGQGQLTANAFAIVAHSMRMGNLLGARREARRRQDRRSERAAGQLTQQPERARVRLRRYQRFLEHTG